MHYNNFFPTFVILLLVAIQYISGEAIILGRMKFRLVSRSKNRPFFRAIIHLWLAIATIYTLAILLLGAY